MMLNFNKDYIPTPSYVIDEELLIKNLEILKSVQDQTGCKIIMALKGFSMFYVFPIISKYLYGCSASSYNEARLAREEMNKEVHIYSPAYREDEIEKILHIVDHIVFNSLSQWFKYKDYIKNFKKKYNKNISCGLRLNPEYSEVRVQLYNPCIPGSRFGIRLSQLENFDFEDIEGLHFHALCEQNSDVLERTLNVFESKFNKFFSKMKWINFGGGHHITRSDYDVNLLINIIKEFRNKYNNIDVYLEPGEAIALNTGFLVASVLDIIENGIEIAILDTSAAAHMPDVLEMPYTPIIIGAGKPGEYKYNYRLGGNTCLAGDIIGDYSFPEPLKIGQKLVFTDMAHYTMVKNNTFNGINLPNIISIDYKTKEAKLIRKFDYFDYRNRLS